MYKSTRIHDRRTERPRIAVTLSLIAALLAGSSCVSANRDKWLRTFFDGVPSEAGQLAPAKQGPAASGKASLATGNKADMPAYIDTMSIHAPYARHECTACHKPSAISQLVMKKSELCFQCHGSLLSMNTGQQATSEQLAALKKAVFDNDLPAVEAGIKSIGTTAFAPWSKDKITLLHVSAALDRQEITTALINAGAPLDARTQNGFTPLHWAASKGALHTAKLLLDAGADVQATTPTGLTPQKLAQSKNMKSMVNLLSTLAVATPPQHTRPELSSIIPKAKYLHSPAEEGECDSCHSAHKSDKPHLLKGEIEDLCFSCHDKDDVTSAKNHVGIVKNSCTSCHVPHAGNVKGLFRDNIKGSSTP